VIDEAEVFDSNLLKDTVNSYIASGKRNFALDLSPLDYIYSDTINALMALNRRILDVSGRLSLLSPQPEVLQILKRAGIHNILRIFETETELMKTSEDIILQTSSIKMGDIQDIAKEAAPESEFDQLRSEIGSVFGAQEAAPHEEVMQKPQAFRPAPSQEEPAFEEPAQESQFMAPPLEKFTRPSMPQFAPPKPQFGAPPQFQSHQFAPPPQKPPVPPKPPIPQSPVFEPAQKSPQRSFTPPESSREPDFSTMRPETQRFATAPVPPSKPVQPSKPEPFISDEKDFDEFEIPSKKKPRKVIEEDFDTSDDFEDEKKKKSPLPIILVVLVLVIGGAGVFFGYSKLSKKPQTPVTVPEKVAPVTPTPAPAVSEVTPAAEPVAEEKKVEEPSAPEPVKAPVAEEKKPAPRKAVAKSAPRPAAPAAPKPAPATPTVNQIAITSNPTGASVKINGQLLGTTPFTWTKPVFGQITISLSKAGYQESTKTIEFTGGSVKESFTLDKEESVPPPPPPPPAPVVKAEPKKAAPPPPPPPEEDDFSLPDPEPAAPPTPAPAAAAAVPSGGGGNASIFIASIPPVADVYLDGKLVGKTNVAEISLPAGTYTLRFVKGAKEMTKSVTLKPGKNPSQMVRLP